jgi:hypothetical protein
MECPSYKKKTSFQKKKKHFVAIRWTFDHHHRKNSPSGHEVDFQPPRHKIPLIGGTPLVIVFPYIFVYFYLATLLVLLVLIP